jgi:hypothetical protein
VAGLAYEMRLVLQGIYELKNVEDVRKLFRNWCNWVRAIREHTVSRSNRLLVSHGR